MNIFGNNTEISSEIDETYNEEMPDTTENENNLPLLKEYAWDFSKDDFILKDKKFVIVEGLEALKIRIYKILRTQKYRYMAYSFSYGNELEDLVGQGYSQDQVLTEVKSLLSNCLVSDYITDVSNLSVELDGSTLKTTGSINSIYGEVFINV